MDVAVNSYIPLWLLQVNEQQNVVRTSIPTKDPEQERRLYIASFSGTDAWQPHQFSAEGAQSMPEALQRQFKEHLRRIARLVELEGQDLVNLSKSWNRYQVPLKALSVAKEARNGLTETSFMCHVAGIQEFRPPVAIGDLVELRQLMPSHTTFDGSVITAKISGVKRSKGSVVLKTPLITIHSGLFNLVFLHDASKTLTQIALLKSIAASASHWFYQVVFPSVSSCRLKTQVTPDRAFTWKDSELNLEQKKAIQEIVDHRYGELPYIISGPPGTGKTKTVVEAILQILEVDPNARIIACGLDLTLLSRTKSDTVGPSNTAADTLALRLIAKIQVTKVLLRLNANSRSFEEIPEPLLPHSFIQNDRFCTPKFSDLMSYRVIVGTIAEVSDLVSIKCTNQCLAQLERFTMRSLHPQNRIPDSKPHFSHLILDEAGQATEPESLCVFKLIEPDHGHTVSVVLAGDQQQLGPRVLSAKARHDGLNKSLFARLIDNPVYSEHPLSRNKIHANPLPPLPYPHPAFCNLYRNYRSHADILRVPSQLFYNSTLVASATNVTSISSAIGEKIPVSFIGHAGLETSADLDVITSWYNQTEIDIIVTKIKSILLINKGAVIKARDIAVLAPFREQVRRLRAELRRHNCAAVGVGTVEDYQGAEARIIIVSMVRATAKHLIADCNNDVGLIHAEKRMNVAITRARELLLVVGNPTLMVKDDCWKTWLSFCERHGTYSGSRPNDDASSRSSSAAKTGKAYEFRKEDSLELVDGCSAEDLSQCLLLVR